MNQTEKQIQDFCKTAEHIAQYNRMPILEAALQIIAQLQNELATEQEKNKRLRDKIRVRRQWQICPTCNKTFATDS